MRLLEMIHDSFSNRKFAVSLGFFDDPARADRNADHLAQMVMNLCREIGQRELPQLLQPPGSWILLMHEDVTVALANRSLIARDYRILVEAENRAATCESCAMLLENVVWQRWAVTRLCFTLLNAEEAEGRRDFSEGLLRILAALFKQIQDEKGAEDIHQHVRDIPRGNRNK